ncbi:sugar phosphate isomerase/epimerase family protein [Gimesia aquarii]|uniref:Xylose isomerase-like TIM barrel n=1 Tax=Gimesia aquarii TaxID=2527964 RepID=A0A517X2J8_9PLAN|nr:sugar phosphate isomerase/epimerase family protein [Gimesia aquarii]QDU11728.1 Xylose isomerase-like TIM barrel [Gimesia aquarii]
MTKELLSQRKVNSFSSPLSSIECQNSKRSISLIDRISVHQITTYQWSLKESLLGLCSAGIPAIGLWNRKILDIELAQAAELVIDSKLKVSTISLGGGFTGGNEYSFKEAISDALEIIKFGGQVNAAAIQVVSGPRAGHTRNHAKQLTIDALKQLGDAAALHGTKLALKVMQLPLGKNWTFLNSLDSALEIIEACNHPAVGIAIDSTQICYEINAQGLFSEIISMIAAVQISDFKLGTSPQQSFSHLDIIEAIDHAGYDGFFDLEIWSEQVWYSDYQNLLSQLRLACQTELPSEF